MFFTETSRKKGHTGDDTTKVIRIHLLGLIAYYSKLIISTLYRKATPRDHIINFLHMHYPTVKSCNKKPHQYTGKIGGFCSMGYRPTEIWNTMLQKESQFCKNETGPFQLWLHNYECSLAVTHLISPFAWEYFFNNTAMVASFFSFGFGLFVCCSISVNWQNIIH